MDLELAGRDRNVETECRSSDWAGGKLQQGRDMGVDGNVEGLSRARAGANRALGSSSPAQAGDSLHRPEYLDKRGEIIWTHVKQRPPTPLEQELRTGGPCVGTGIAER